MVLAAERGIQVGPRIDTLTPLREPLEIQKTIEGSIFKILKNQHPVSGLFPASDSETLDRTHSYDKAWVRDGSLVAFHLNDPYLRKLYPAETAIGNAIDNASIKFVEGVLRMIQKDPWQQGFDQEVIKKQHPFFPQVTYNTLTDTKKAPPIQSTIEGKASQWPEQMQPDSWGFFNSTVARVLQQTESVLDSDEQKTLNKMNDYLLRLEPWKIQCASMWEWGMAHTPTPLSTVAAIYKGFQDILPFASPFMQQKMKREIFNMQQHINASYPTDYSTPNGHFSKTDLSTLVVRGTGALDHLPISTYFLKAKPDLGINSNEPGQVRYKGDPYHRTTEGEALWIMGTIYKALELARMANKSYENGGSLTGNRWNEMARAEIRKVIELQRQHSIIPELFERKNGKLELPEEGGVNDLLWNHAVMAATLAEIRFADHKS
ncbi:MAG: glycoside hydrolase family 15 protein [Candidatus Levybacteria bacterium]|nr:glycoside hydrolase family 15 protein [Candidatus Levybacteria bacterium]MDZ4228457.1 glycoside hydrolase family 15 protein [Candidatus Levybacteria bacterium]